MMKKSNVLKNTEILFLITLSITFINTRNVIAVTSYKLLFLQNKKKIEEQLSQPSHSCDFQMCFVATHTTNFFSQVVITVKINVAKTTNSKQCVKVILQ